MQVLWSISILLIGSFQLLSSLASDFLVSQFAWSLSAVGLSVSTGMVILQYTICMFWKEETSNHWDVLLCRCCLYLAYIMGLYNPLGNLNSGRRPWTKLIRNASLQRVFDAAIAKLLWRLVCRCFYMAICVFFYDNVKLRRMAQNVYRQSPDGDTERLFLTVIYAVCRLLDKLHIFSNILCTCSIFIKMWTQI